MSRTFNQVISPTGNNLLVVDGLNLAFRYKYAKKTTFAVEYCNTVASLAKSYGASKVVVLFDRGSSFRENILATYKQARKDKRKEQTEEEAQEMEAFFDEFNNNTLTMLAVEHGYTVLGFKGVEADDIAAYLVKSQKDNYDHIWLISSDKDWDLLINETTSRFSYVTRKEVTFENWKEHYGYEIDEHISIKVLMGDTGDSVPGVPGVGEKRAISLIEQYGDALSIYDSIPLDGRAKYIQNLNEFGDNIITNYQLMDLLTYCEEAIGKENIEQINLELE